MRDRPYVQDSRGVTLIELLIVLAISSFLVIVVSNVLIYGARSSEETISQTELQEEANLVMTALTRYYEQTGSYTITLDQNPEAEYIEITGDNGEQSRYEKEGIAYSLYFTDGNRDPVPLHEETAIDTGESFPVKIIVMDENHQDRQFELRSIISKL